jgi:hypothetical protein
MFALSACAHITPYTPHHEPSLPSSLRPTIYYLTVDGPVDQVVRAPVPWLAPLLDLVQVVQAQRNGRALPYLTESVVVQELLEGPNPADDGVPTNSPPSPRCCRALSALLITQGAIMDRHVAMTPSRSDAVSAAPTRPHLVGGWAHGASTAVAAAVMPRSSRRRRADTARRTVLYVPGQCLKVRHGHVAWGILVEVVIGCLAGGHRLWWWRQGGREGGSVGGSWRCVVVCVMWLEQGQ